jgi:hypothetical protein
MVVHLKPEREADFKNSLRQLVVRLKNSSKVDGGYVVELTQVRDMPDSRYDEKKSGRVLPVEGEQACVQLRTKNQNR